MPNTFCTAAAKGELKNREKKRSGESSRRERGGEELMVAELFPNYVVNPSTCEGDLSAYLAGISKQEEAI